MDNTESVKSNVEKRLRFLEEISLLGKFHFQSDVIIERLLKIIKNYMSAQGCLAAIKDEEKEQIRIYWDSKEDSKKHTYAMTEQKGLLFSESGGRIYKGDDKFPLKENIEALLGVKYRNGMMVALNNKESYLGFIQLFNKVPEDGNFTQDDLDFLSQYSSQILALIETAIIFERLQERVRELDNMGKATESINSTLDLDRLLDIILEMGAQMLNAQGCSLLLIDEEKKCLNFTAASGVKKEVVKGMSLELGEGIVGSVAEKAESIIVNDIEKDNRFSTKIDRVTQIPTKKLICVPMKIADRVIGVLEVVNKLDNQRFTQRDLDILAKLSQQAAIAINKAQLYTDLDDLFFSTIKAIAESIEFKDPYTRGHCERIRRFSVSVAQEMKLSPADIKDMEIAALLHDLGKIGVPESILKKVEKLNDEDWKVIKKHPAIGAEILSSIKQFKSIVPIVRHHHERMDGKGYPDGLKADQIPLKSKIIAVCDAFDAMTSERVYRRGVSDEEAIEELKRNIGSQFDGSCVDAFINIYKRDFVVKRIDD